MKKFQKILMFLVLVVFLMAGSVWAAPFNTRPYTGLPYDTTWAATHTYSESTLQEVFNDKTDDGSGGHLDAVNDQSASAIWGKGEGDTDAYLVSMMRGDDGSLGIYSYSTQAEYVLLGGSDSKAGFLINDAGGLVIDDVIVDNSFGTSFGFYWENKEVGHEMFSYTEDDKNSTGKGYGDENVLALAYFIPDGWEINTMAGGAGSTLTAYSSGDNDWVLAFEDRPYGDTGGWGDGDFNDAVFYVEDMNPVPEPATLFLLGSGLIGLAGIGRKKILRSKK